MSGFREIFGGGVKSVQRGSTSVGASASLGVTVASVNPAKAMLIPCGATSNGGVGAVRMTLTNATTITLTNAGGSTVVQDWQLVEFF